MARLTPRQRDYRDALNAVIKRYGNLESETLRRMVDLLVDLRRSLADEILAGAGGELEIASMQQARDSAARLIQSFEGSIVGLTQTAVNGAIRQGSLSVVEPLQATGFAVTSGPTPAQVNMIVDFTADLIQGVTGEALQKINSQLRMAALGGRTARDTMREISKILGFTGRGAGREIVGGIGYNAERIVRTEMGRAFNLSSLSQMQQTAQQEPGLQKRWIATGDARTRASHLRAHIATANEPIPVGQPFVVGGAELRAPGDPAGPADETINCRCTMVTVHPDIGIIDSPLDDKVQGILDDKTG